MPERRNLLLLICVISAAAGAPAGVLKITKSGVPLFLVTDFQIIESYTDDAGSLEEFSGNLSAADNRERAEREANDTFPSSESELDFLSNVLANPVIYTKDIELIKRAKLTNRLPTPYQEEDFSDNLLRILRSVPNKPLVEPAIFPHEEHQSRL